VSIQAKPMLMNKSMDALNDDIVSFENRGQQNTAKSVYNDANFE